MVMSDIETAVKGVSYVILLVWCQYDYLNIFLLSISAGNRLPHVWKTGSMPKLYMIVAVATPRLKPHLRRVSHTGSVLLWPLSGTKPHSH